MWVPGILWSEFKEHLLLILDHESSSETNRTRTWTKRKFDTKKTKKRQKNEIRHTKQKENSTHTHNKTRTDTHTHTQNRIDSAALRAGWCRALGCQTASDTRSCRAGPTVGHVTPAPLRLVVLDTAGTGKSDTLRATVASVETLWGAGNIVRCVHTGVAAFNAGAGAETINSVFMLNQEPRGEDLGRFGGAAHRSAFAHYRRGVHGGSKQFRAVSQRLEAVARTFWRKLRGPRAPHQSAHRVRGEPDNFGGLGGVGVLLVGDFGQIPPIGEPHSVRKKVARGGGRPEHLPQFPRSHPLAPFTASVVATSSRTAPLRLRDGAMSLSDYALWAQHDLAPKSLDSAIRRVLEEEALWLVSQNAKAASRNGAKLARLAEVRGGTMIWRPNDHLKSSRSSAHEYIWASVHQWCWSSKTSGTRALSTLVWWTAHAAMS